MPKFLLVILLLFTSQAAAAQEQSHIDAAKELLEVGNVKRILEQSYDALYPQLAGMADQMGITDEQRPIFDRFLQKMVAAMKESMSWEKMEPRIVNAYMAVYTEEELRELTEFYRSPLGQKFLSKMPKLAQQTMQMSQDMLQDFLPKLTEIQKELQAELQEQAQQ